MLYLLQNTFVVNVNCVVFLYQIKIFCDHTMRHQWARHSKYVNLAGEQLKKKKTLKSQD